ncbi:MAG: ribosome biogenesis GTPase Der [Alphaproteobacteria bacterium]
MSFTVAIVGRPNVGKSTLYNRLTGKRRALVDDQPGVTRDRREGTASIGDLKFTIIDTAGLEQAEDGTLAARMSAQSEKAITQADITMLVVDGKSGITPVDEHFAKLIRKKHAKVILVVNKAESKQAQAAMADAYRLGLGEPVAISAEHGDGLVDLYDALAKFRVQSLESSEEAIEKVETPKPDILSLAIIGRPNVGKSTMFNRILGEERTLTGPEAGITRDAISVECEFQGKKLKLVDTAGMRRKAGVVEKVEKLAVADTIETLKYAHVVIWMVDANQPLEKQDNTIAALVEQEGRALVLAVNKWDEVDDPQAWLKALYQRLDKVLPQVRGVPVIPVSAKTGYNMNKLLNACFDVYETWNKHIGTGELNRWLEAMLESHTPPLINGRRIKIRYMTQKSSRPPSFILFSNLSDIPESYLRYLVNGMRERFGLQGVPIRIKIRKNKNPYEGKKDD